MSYRTHNPVLPAAPSLHFPLKGKKLNTGPTPATVDALEVLVAKLLSQTAQEQLQESTALAPQSTAPKRL